MNENTIHRPYNLSYFDICLSFKVFHFILTFSKSVPQSSHYIQKIQLHDMPGTSQFSSGMDSVVTYYA